MYSLQDRVKQCVAGERASEWGQAKWGEAKSGRGCAAQSQIRPEINGTLSSSCCKVIPHGNVCEHVALVLLSATCPDGPSS